MNNNPTQFIEIMYDDELASDDLEFLRLATAKRPGLVSLNRATVGEPHPQAPNSRPVFSGGGPQFGFVASVDLMDEPYTYTYLLQENGKNGRNGTD